MTRRGRGFGSFAPDRIASLTGETLPECTNETATGESFRVARDIYRAEGANEQSVPILYDKKSKRIVNNESAEIIRMLDRHAAALGSRIDDGARFVLYPDQPDLRAAIDDLNDLIYTNINNGAYKAGFSSDQSVYKAAFEAYFDTLSALDGLLSDGAALSRGATSLPMLICGCSRRFIATTRFIMCA